MIPQDFTRIRIACLRPLALTFALSGILASAADAGTPALPRITPAAALSPERPMAPQNWVVQNCSDAAPGSLRDIIENPANAQSGDTVDLSQLPMLCAVANSTISLTTGEITINQGALTLIGPDPSIGSVTISGGGASRVLKHTGSGVLAVRGLTVANGYAHAAGDIYGGCIEGAGPANSVYLYSSTVTQCHVVSDSGRARGGAIHSLGDVSLVLSIVSGSKASAPTKRSYGGGIDATNVSANYGSIHDNVAEEGQSGGSCGGGAYARAGMTIFASTIDHNRASYGGGLFSRASSMLVNSTLSDNASDLLSGGWYSRGESLSIWNSTIAFNHANADTAYGAITFRAADPTSPLDIRSSIVANNPVGANQTPGDIFIFTGSGVLTGADSLVIASNVSDPSVIVSTEDPMLGPLQFNGGPTMTRLLQAGSPALNLGSSVGGPNDQRGPGYPRSTGTSTDIGAVQFDEIFPDGFD